MVTQVDAEQLALSFLMDDLEIPETEREWFAILHSRAIQDTWQVVEIGVEGVPDKWVIQVYDTGECDPNYTFVSPMKASMGRGDLEELPDLVADVIAAQRTN